MSLRGLTCAALLAFRGHALDLHSRKSNDEDTFRVRDRQSLTVLGDYLYLVGGRISEYSNGVRPGNNDWFAFASSYAVSLAHSWDNATVETVPSVWGPSHFVDFSALWADEEGDVLYRWGGRDTYGRRVPSDVQGRNEAPTLWRFTADGGGSGKWEAAGAPPLSTISGSGDDVYAAAQGGWATCGRKGLMAGGIAFAATDARLDEDEAAEPGMVVYDLDSHSWEKESTATLNWPEGTLVNTAGVCLEKDDHLASHPLFFVLGGTKRSRRSFEELDVRPFDNITFFDTESRTWHWQEARGQVPRSRERFCAAGQRGHNGTYEIFVYGGNNPFDSNKEALNHIHILSLPGFQWFQVDAKSTPRRLFHACATLPGGQIAISGGVATENTYKDQDVWENSLSIFDMGALEWSDGYDANKAEYETPQVIRDWYNEGGLNSVNWVGEVEGLFMRDDGDDKGQGEQGHENQETEDQSSGTPTGAIVGGAVGGVLGLALLGGLVLFCIRRRRRTESEKDNALAPTELGPSPLPSELTSSPSPPLPSKSPVTPAELQSSAVPSQLLAELDGHSVQMRP